MAGRPSDVAGKPSDVANFSIGHGPLVGNMGYKIRVKPIVKQQKLMCVKKLWGKGGINNGRLVGNYDSTIADVSFEHIPTLLPASPALKEQSRAIINSLATATIHLIFPH